MSRTAALLTTLDRASLDSKRAPDARRILGAEANELRAVIQRGGNVEARAEEARATLAMWEGY